MPFFLVSLVRGYLILEETFILSIFLLQGTQRKSQFPFGKSFLAIDTVQAGAGDTVLVMEEGGSARLILDEPETFTVKAIIAGIVDEIHRDSNC